MPIQILPPQLANQIAAGEVVERPASVVKELVENALDAGACQIEIEIDKGGHKRILIRDDGKGISKDELGLALSRHATSKISDIDDLEAIVSLGFRGEALASISSVSRLTMTSKPKQQKEAWSAIAEGLDMAVKVLPAAHPNGTSVEVLDLFFNTPARRKFLRAEKTEFSHIESLIKRIALSRPDVTVILKHNNKLVKRYRSQAKVEGLLEQKSNRIAEVINANFIEAANAVSSHYDQVKISVWAKAPSLCVSVNPAQFSFVNGRMMRDKLIQHAIRQAYGEQLGPEQLPEYVIFIELPAQDVDVNVHPAKHEVRFHYARLLHDLLVKTIEEALAGFNQQQQIAEATPPDWLEAPNHSYQQAQAATEIVKSELKPQQASRSTPSTAGHFPGLKPIQPEYKPNTQMVIDEAVEQIPEQQKAEYKAPIAELESTQFEQEQQASIIFVEQNRYCYFSWQQQLWLIDEALFITKHEASLSREQLTSSPLLVPVRLRLTEAESIWCEQNQAFLIESGFEIKRHQDFLIIKQVPAVLRSLGSNQALPTLVSELMLITEPNINALQQLISQAKDNNTSPEHREFKLNQFITENKLNLERVAKKLDAQTLWQTRR